MKKFFLFFFFALLSAAAWFFYSEIYAETASSAEKIFFQVKDGETASSIAERFEKEGVVRHDWIFRRYLAISGIDKKIQSGDFELFAPITAARVADVLQRPGVGEKEITIIPGWDLRDIADYLKQEGFVRDAEEFYAVTGFPAVNYKIEPGKAPKNDLSFDLILEKPEHISWEGYLAPETYRVYKNSSAKDLAQKFMRQMEKEIKPEWKTAVESSDHSWHEIITMASLLEREVRSKEDRAIVADIFWRRKAAGWAMQADSTVHYTVDKSGTVFTTKEERDNLSPWNTYKYPGLPIGPICSPSALSIEAAIYPKKNDYWYFLTTLDGEVKYARNLSEHNRNVSLFLR